MRNWLVELAGIIIQTHVIEVCLSMIFIVSN